MEREKEGEGAEGDRHRGIPLTKSPTLLLSAFPYTKKKNSRKKTSRREKRQKERRKTPGQTNWLQFAIVCVRVCRVVGVRPGKVLMAMGEIQ
ncbi:hypothetical protein AGIG_G21808 [Arapaima gigas]